MTIPHDALASVHSRGDKSPHIGLVESWLRSLLATLPEGEPETTRQLIDRLAIPDTEQLLKKRLTQSLWVLRKAGRIEDCYTTDPTRRWFGNPLILWQRPVALPMNEEIF